MDEKKLDLKIITPRGVKWAKQIDSVVFRCVDGDMGVLPGHEPISVVMGDGALRAKNGDEEFVVAIFGGVAKIEDNGVTILTPSAQKPGEIDLGRAENDRDRLEKQIKDNGDNSDLQIQSHLVALRRALVRIEVANVLPPKDE